MKKNSHPIEVWSFVFKYLRYIDLIEASTVCTEWGMIIQKGKFLSKLKETHDIFTDREWLMKSYRKNFDRFGNDMYWEILNYLSHEKIRVLNREIYCRMFYSVLPFRVWNHWWSCCRSQFDKSICQFCTKLQIKDKKVTKAITKKLKLDARNFFPPELYYGVVSNGLVSLFVHVEFGPDRQRPYSENNYGVLHYEEINSPFMVFKAYLDILGKIILNQCDKYLLSALFANENFGQCRRSTFSIHHNCFSIKKRKILREKL